MFTIIDIVILAALAFSFIGNIWLAYTADRYETHLKKVAATYWHAYRDLAEGADKEDVFDALMRDLDHDLND